MPLAPPTAYPVIGTFHADIENQLRECRMIEQQQAYQAGFAAAAAGRSREQLPSSFAADSLEAHSWRVGWLVYSRLHSVRTGGTTS